MKRLSFLAMGIALTLCSCAAPSGEGSYSDTSYQHMSQSINLGEGDMAYQFRYNGLLTKKADGSPAIFEDTLVYNDSYFSKKGTEFNKNLALMSYPLNYAAVSKEKGADFYSAIGFSNVYYSPDYELEDSPESVLFSFATKAIDGNDVVAVTLNGLSYKMPWANNFNLGKTGDAEGFLIGARKVLTNLREYLGKSSSHKKIWITGYSRSAAIASMVARSLLEEDQIAEDDMYCYAFEAPAAFDKASLKEHPSIFNVMNHGDFVTYIAPKEFGFVRAGVEIDTYPSNIDEVLNRYDTRLSLPAFADPSDIAADEPAYANWLLGKLMSIDSHSQDDPDYVPDIATREHYVDNDYQRDFTFLLSLFMKLPVQTINGLLKRLVETGLAILNPAELYAVIKAQLEEDKIPFDDKTLEEVCNHLMQFAFSQGFMPLFSLLVEEYANDLTRMILLHSTEYTFPLLLAYKPK